MPIYEFRCTECDEVSEEMLSFKDKKKTINCPVCDSRSERILSLGSFHLKGAGWAKDGYGDKRKISKEEKVERSTLTTSNINTATKEGKIKSSKPLDAKSPEARSLVDD